MVHRSKQKENEFDARIKAQQLVLPRASPGAGNAKDTTLLVVGLMRFWDTQLFMTRI
jgi:hypothetical protein